MLYPPDRNEFRFVLNYINYTFLTFRIVKSFVFQVLQKLVKKLNSLEKITFNPILLVFSETFAGKQSAEHKITPGNPLNLGGNRQNALLHHFNVFDFFLRNTIRGQKWLSRGAKSLNFTTLREKGRQKMLWFGGRR